MLDRFLGGYVTASPTAPTQTSAQGVWELEQQASAQVQNAWPLPPNVIQRSLRFNSADSAYLNRTPAASNRTTWTWSGWVKLSAFGAYRGVFVRADTYIYFNANNKIEINLRNAATNYFLITTPVYRDPSAWYHIVVTLDTNNGVAADRLKLYVNNVRVEQYDNSTYQSIGAGYEPLINSAAIHYIGGSGTGDFNGYMAEVNFVDGQALTPSSFGETDPQTGVWIPKVYTGSYGTNGFRLRFNNNSSTTALGYDTSGNGNNWTPNNFSVTAGSGNDSMLDVPSLYGTDTGLGGEVRGNYATFNPLSNPGNSTLTNGNLDVSTPNSTAGRVLSTIAPSSGKWYCEFTVTNVGAGFRTGVVLNSFNNGDIIGNFPNEYAYYSDGNKYSNSVAAAYGASYTTNDTISVALDLDAGTISFYKNGVNQGVAYTGLSGSFAFGVCDITGGGGVSAIANFGQRPFAYTAPSGFKALCTTNLSASGTVTTSGTFTGNASTDGPFIYLNGIPTAMTINGNAVTFGTQADKLSNGFKVRSSSSSYNTSGSNTYSVSTTGAIFRYSNAQGNP